MQFKVGNPNLGGNSETKKSEKEQGSRVFNDDYADTRALEGEEREKFMSRYMDIINIIARTLIKNRPASVDINDLVQCGIVGLSEAMNNFQPEKKILFRTFAISRIRGAMIDFSREQDHLHRITRQNVKKILGVLQKNEHRKMKGLEPLSEEEMASEIGMRVKDFRDCLVLSKTDPHEYLDEPVLGHDIKKGIVDQSVNQEAALHRKEMNKILKEAFQEFLSSITEEKKRARFELLYERYYVQGIVMPTIGKELGIDHSRVSQLLTQLRQGIGEVLERKGIKPEDINW